MKALSLRRPWDYVVLHPPFKNVENRTWPTSYRGRVCIHRAKAWDWEWHDWLWFHRFELGIDTFDFEKIRALRLAPSGLVGEVDITGCVKASTEPAGKYPWVRSIKQGDPQHSPWFSGPYGFILANPRAYDAVVDYRGRLGLFDVPDEVVRGL